MGNTLDEEIIRTRIPVQINYLVLLLIFLFVCFILIMWLYDYGSYYSNTGIVTKIDNAYYLKAKVLLEDVKYIERGNVIRIDDNCYKYSYQDIDKKLYVDDTNSNNYKYLYLTIDNIPYDKRQENYLLDFKIEQDRKKLIEYLFKYLGRSL